MISYVEVDGPGVFSLPHIIYLLIVVAAMLFGWIFIPLKVKKQETKDLIIKISAWTLLVFIIANRISIALMKDAPEAYGIYFNWKYLFPDSFCGVSSLVLALAVILGKKDNNLLHCFCYISLVGGILNIVYPTYLNTQYFDDIRTLTGLIHHTIGVWLVVLLTECDNFTPTTKKWYIFPTYMFAVMTYGLFLYDAIGMEAMQIKAPLLSSLPILSSWYGIGGLSVLLTLVIEILFEKFKKKKSFKEIFNKENWTNK